MEPIDYTRYKWRKDDKNPRRYKREPAGGELIGDVWNLIKHGDQNLFIGVYATLSQQLSPTALLAQLRSAWISLRWDIPTVAAQTAHIWHEGKLPTTFITYDSPSSTADVQAWAETTFSLREGVKDLDALRYEIGQGPNPPEDLVPQTFGYLVPFSSTTFGVLLHTSHVPFDGAGIKIVVTKLFDHLSAQLSDPSYASTQTQKHKWGEEIKNLLPVASDILRKHEPAEKDAQGNIVKAEVPEESLDGPKYVETLTKVMKGLAQGHGGPLSHLFKSFINPPFDLKTTKPKVRRIGRAFSLEESQKIIASTRRTPNDKLTVNHIAHGALCLVTIFDNPPPPDSPAVVFFYGLVDARQRLAKEYRDPLGYPGYCLGMSAIQIPVKVAAPYKNDPAEHKELVLALARAVRAEYKKQQEYPSLLAIEAQQVELMLSAKEPPPPWCGPGYAADGRGAVYLRPKYPATCGLTNLEITDFFVGINKTDPGPFFRATEWNGRIMLSADFNELAVELKVAEGWIKQWAELLLAASA